MRKKVQAIIYRDQKGKKEYLILQRKLHWSGWELLKETMEGKESFEETLRRGLQEEIGVTKLQIEKEMSVSIPMTKEDVIVYAYLVQIDSKEKIDITKEQEHSDFKWVSKEEAIQLLKFENSKRLLKELS